MASPIVFIKLGSTYDIGSVPAGQSWELVVQFSHLQETCDIRGGKPSLVLHGIGLVLITIEEMLGGSERVNAIPAVRFVEPIAIRCGEVA